MSCLKDILCGTRTIIGIRDYTDCASPESDLWINDFPGISLKTAAKISNEEVHTGAAIMRKCIDVGTKKVFDDFQKKISPYFDFNSIVETRQIDDFSDDIILPVAAAKRGLALRRWRSELAQHYIEELYIKSKTTKDTSVFIYDGETLAYTYVIPLIAGTINTIRVGKTFVSETVKIEMDNSDVEVYSNSINNSNWSDGGCGSCQSLQGLKVKGWNGTSEDNTVYGIGVKCSVRCYLENAMCSVLPQLYLPIFYKSAGEFFREKIGSDRLNPVTLFTKDQARESLDECEKDYKEIYASTINSIYAFLRSTKGECLTCNTNRYAQVHP